MGQISYNTLYLLYIKTGLLYEMNFQKKKKKTQVEVSQNESHRLKVSLNFPISLPRCVLKLR